MFNVKKSKDAKKHETEKTVTYNLVPYLSSPRPSEELASILTDAFSQMESVHTTSIHLRNRA